MAETMEHEPLVFPDQGRKLDYLLNEWGDPRTPSPRNRLLALSELVTRSGAYRTFDLIRSQAKLAEALGVNESAVSRWAGEKQRIPLKHLAELCHIFAVDETAFKELDLAAFREACRAAAPARAKADWRAILRRPTTGLGRIMLRDPAGSVGKARYAGIPAEDAAKDPLPEVPAGSPFWMEFASPLGANGKTQLWAGWHALLFNHDLGQQGFRCLLPAYRQHSAFAVDTFPARGPLELPRKPILTHPATDAGDFEMVLAVSQEAFPDAIAEPLANINAYGLAIEDTLRQLAEWINPRIAQARAAVARAPYRVIESLETHS